jgi:hypothetical protein
MDEKSRRALISLGASIPIGALGGLIGLGGAEFRLPVLEEKKGVRNNKTIRLNGS